MPEIKFYNTLTKQEEVFTPLKKSTVTIYTCGPTVYDYPHTGNLRKYIFDDLLIRTLLANDYKVKHVINITDIGHLVSDADAGEDKMMKALKREGLEPSAESLLELAGKYTRAFIRDIAALNIFAYNTNKKYTIIWAKVTEHIKDQIKLIKKLQKKGYVYETSDGWYFDTSKFKNYGQLTGQNLCELQEGARVEKNEEKKNPTDFVLWVKAIGDNKNHVMVWDSPFGTGFPGWHIECSAMAMRYLGPTLDIHTGGIDHIPVHHTNEIAQSEAATGKSFSNFWLHSNFLTVNKEKMSKSSGGFATLEDLQKENYSPMDYRYFCLTANYRTPLAYSLEALTGAKNSRLKMINELVKTSQRGQIIEEKWQNFLQIINHDLDSPQALAFVWQLLKDKNYQPEDIVTTILKCDEVLGLDLKLAWKQLKQTRAESAPAEVVRLAEERLQAKQKKDFAAADQLRQKIETLGWQISDAPEGYTLKRK